ncbi:Ig-like domain-containing protein [Candidatus Omnitrophota bacterium]
MKLHLCFLVILAALFLKCENKTIYRDDPRLYNDAYHGSIVGKIMQTGVTAAVIINQEVQVDSTDVNPDDGTFRLENLPIGNYDLTIKAENFRTYIHNNVMVEGAGTTYIGEIDLSTVPDLVSYHYPNDLDELVFSSSYSRLSTSIAFTQPMDRESVEQAFSTDPPSDGIFNWGNYIYFPRDDDDKRYDVAEAGGGGATITTFSKISSFTYVFAQKDSYTDTTYVVTLSTAAQDTAGNHLKFPLNYSFSAVQSATTLQGIQTVPSHGDINVGLISSSGIQVTFPRNMDQKSTEASIKMVPDIERIYIWPANNQLTIYTGGPYIAETTYEIEIGGEAKDLDGIQLGEPFSFSFTTDTVNITSTTPANGQLYVSFNDPYVTLWFNTYMVKSTVEKAFSITPEVSGRFKWGTKSGSNESSNTITFLPSEKFKQNTKYTVTIDANAQDLYGTGLYEPYIFSFVTRPE